MESRLLTFPILEDMWASGGGRKNVLVDVGADCR